MPSAATVTSLIAIAACVTGAVVALEMWKQRRRAARARRLRHPSSPPPVSIVIDQPTGRWRLEVAPDAPPTAVDIVSWRPSHSSAAWTSEPIVEPIELGPGGWALTSSEPPRAAVYDVALAWTSHSDAGELQGSRTVQVDGRPQPRGAAPPIPPSRSPLGWPLIEIALAAVLLLALLVVVILWQTDGSDGTDGELVVATSSGTPAPSTTPASETSGPPGSVASTVTPSATPTPPTTTPVTTAQATTTTSPTTTSPTTTTTSTTVPGPSIQISATIDACQAGPDCLVASFAIDGFDTAPTSYVCEFADGDRITFGFGGDSVERACATGSADASITIEIDGVRSATVTRADAG